MNINLKLNEQEITEQILAIAKSVTPAVESSMAERFKEMTLSNFGIAGADRPLDWPRLSPRYARKVGREIATLVVSGRLKGAIHTEGNVVSVSNAQVPYAVIHQTGGKNMPARPYFPIRKDGTCMPYTLSEVTASAQKELDSKL